MEGESGRDAHIFASAPSLEAAPQRSAGTPHGIGATPWGTKPATRRARFAHVCAGGAPATGVASGANGRATKPTSQGPGVVRGTATDMGEQQALFRQQFSNLPWLLEVFSSNHNEAPLGGLPAICCTLAFALAGN